MHSFYLGVNVQSSVAQNNSLFKWNICMTSIASSFHCVWCLQPRSKQGPKLYNSLQDTALMKNQNVYYNKFNRSLACLSLYIWAEKFLQSKLNRCLIIDFYCRLKKSDLNLFLHKHFLNQQAGKDPHQSGFWGGPGKSELTTWIKK